MIGKQDDLDRLGWIVQIYVSVRVWVFVARDRSDEKLHTTRPLSPFGAHVGQGSILRSKSSLHELRAKQTIWKSRGMAHGHFNRLHGLGSGDTEFAPHECHPDSARNLRVQSLFRQQSRQGVICKFRLAFEALRLAAQPSPAVLPIAAAVGHNQSLRFEPSPGL